MTKILGLDVSSLNTGVTVTDETGNLLFRDVWSPKAELDYIDRGLYQETMLMIVLDHFTPDVVLIEGYSLGSTNGAEPLITVGAILRRCLRKKGYDWYDVAPTRLKKFVGADKKEGIKLAAFKRWGFEDPSNDVTDAYVMCRIGAAILDVGAEGLIKPQVEVARDLIDMKKPKEPKAKKPAKKQV